MTYTMVLFFSCLTVQLFNMILGTMFYFNSIFRVDENIWCARLIAALFVKMMARVSA